MTIKTLIIAAALLAGMAHAQSVDVKDAWVRTSVPGQKATGAFMKLTANILFYLVTMNITFINKNLPTYFMHQLKIVFPILFVQFNYFEIFN